MSDDTPVYMLSVEGDMTRGDMIELRNAIRDALDRAGSDAEALLINGRVEAVDKDDLLEALNE